MDCVGDALRRPTRHQKRKQTKSIRQAVVDRAGSRCENCGNYIGAEGHLDHAFGRKRVPQSVEVCWYLCPYDHHLKTLNRPSIVDWLRSFARHARRHGYVAAELTAHGDIAWHEAKDAVGVRS